MEEEPKGSQNQTISEFDESSKASPSKEKHKDTSNLNDTPSKDSSTNRNSSRRFRDFLMGSDIDNHELDSSNKKSEEKSKVKKVDNNEEDKNGLIEAHEFSLSQEFMKFKIYRYLQSNKKQVIQIIGGIIGVLFIIAGILYEFGSSVRVADNVVYGERAVLSVFSILIGILIIAGFFGRQLLARTFLKKIHSELEEVEDQPSNKESSNGKEKSLDGKEKQKDNIDEKDKK